MRRRLTECQHLRALGQPVARKRFQDSLSPVRVPSLAVYHAHAAQAAPRCIVQEFEQQPACFVGLEAVQVKAVLHRPLPAAQLAQGHARNAGAHEFAERLISGGMIGKGVGNGLRGRDVVNRRVAGWRGRRGAVGRRQWNDILHRLPEQLGINGRELFFFVFQG